MVSAEIGFVFVFFSLGILFLVLYRMGFGLSNLYIRLKKEGVKKGITRYIFLDYLFVGPRSTTKSERSDLGWAALLCLLLPLAIILGLLVRKFIYN